MTIIERPRTYIKGPDVGSKSKRTVYRYRDLLSDQLKLEDCGFEPVEPWWRSQRVETNYAQSDTSSEAPDNDLQRTAAEDSSPTHPINTADITDCDTPDVTATQTSDDGLEPEDLEALGDAESIGGHYGNETVEDWEEEIHDYLVPTGPETQMLGNRSHPGNIRSWQDLREQIKADLKRNHRNLSLSPDANKPAFNTSKFRYFAHQRTISNLSQHGNRSSVA